MAVYKAGTRLKSAVCSSELMIVVAPARDVTLTCGGAPVIALADEAPGGAVDPAHKNGTQMGKRYTNAEGDIEILCTKPGEGSLAVDGTALEVKGAKPLPSSD
ncbi:MAG: hypothetical protein H6748_00445 [Spirochaetaceae bacterium]|nr:hypothetical protein [Myxococcales bacterium]MCB9722495.1 hypothetical protein [Spirochaetaceae bacterium]HPG29053.1 hypothetical protein [Myxococcota bacterium]